jgi:hypothetical protein
MTSNKKKRGGPWWGDLPGIESLKERASLSLPHLFYNWNINTIDEIEVERGERVLAWNTLNNVKSPDRNVVIQPIRM